MTDRLGEQGAVQYAQSNPTSVGVSRLGGAGALQASIADAINNGSSNSASSRLGGRGRCYALAGLAYPYPLDQVTGTGPVFAYGTKKLKLTYTGSAFRVVRASDSATLDIGFVDASLDQAALDTFLSGTTGKIDIWYDQTGNGFDATQTTDAIRPHIGDAKIGGVVAPYFQSYNMSIPVGAVIEKTTMTLFSVFDNHSTNGQSSICQIGSGANQSSILRVAGATQPYWAISPGADSTIHPQTKPCLQEFAFTTAVRLVREDGIEYTLSSAVTPLTLTGGLIGNTALAAGYDAIGYLACLVGYSRTFTAGEKTTLRNAFNTVFRTEPAGSGRVIYAGDSIPATSTTGLKYYGFAKQAYRQLSSKVAMYNVASGGSQVQNAITTFDGATGPGDILNKFSDNRILFLHGGTNDLTIGARTAAQIYGDIQTYAGLVRATGGKIIVSTLLPNSAWNVTQQTTRNDLNALIVANWASFADGLADFAADATMGPQAAASNTTLYVDGLHPTVLGHSYLAPIAAAAVNALL